MSQSFKTFIYVVTGCEEEAYNDIYNFQKTTGNGESWWIGKTCMKFLRHSPNYGWSLGWYTNSDKGTVAPKDGWTFNGGRCDPADLGKNITITQKNHTTGDK